LQAYGTQTNLVFAIPSGAERLAAPHATATIIPNHPAIAQQIPPCSSADQPPHPLLCWRIKTFTFVLALITFAEHQLAQYVEAMDTPGLINEENPQLYFLMPHVADDPSLMLSAM
ncbi:hypothetical protein L0F63_004011, partial [Massospora cicadina]